MQGSVRKKIAILGGGIGALSAAFRLTQMPGAKDRFDITVYQLGWRLGGKGASARNPDCNNRIEEHGLHVWAGFYETAFNMMNAVYADDPFPASPIRTIEQAFLKQSNVRLADQQGGQWTSWDLHFPPNDAWPGDGKDDLPGPAELLAKVMDRLAALHSRLPAHLREVPTSVPAIPFPLATGTALLESARAEVDRVLGICDAAVTVAPANRAGDLLRTYHQDVVTQLAEPAQAGSPVFRELLIGIDLLRCIASAIILDGVLFGGFEQLDGEDFIEMLRRQGALDVTLQSPAVLSGYDYAFGYPAGDHGRPSLSAASAVEGLLRLGLTYKGALFFKMAAGAGEIIFAPAYQALCRRGVKFAFFQRVTKLVPGAGSIVAIEIDVQAETKPGNPPYSPLLEVDGLPCWPAHPLYDQLINGDVLRRDKVDLENEWQTYKLSTRRLTRGIDFDDVVLGIPVGALGPICANLAVPGSRWARMLGAIKTTATQALQLWCDQPVEGFGGPFVTKQLPPDAVGTIVTNFAPALDTWADMSHLLARESWPAGTAPKSLAYFCAVLPDQPPPPPGTDPLAAAQAAVKSNAVQWLNQAVRALWPNAADANGFNWSILRAGSASAGADRLNDQYWRANVTGSERYVLSLPGTLKDRLEPKCGEYGNLYLAGDWVRVTSINAGCMECAVMAGYAAAEALAADQAAVG